MDDANNDLFNELFGNDFFNNNNNSHRIDPSDFIDEHGNINYEKLREHSSKIFEELTGHKPDDLYNIDSISADDLFPSLDGDKIGMGFVQDLDSKESQEMFDNLVKQHGLNKDSEIINVKGEEYVQEIWTNDSETIRVKRVYKLNDDTTSKMLSDEEKIKLHEAKLHEAVEIENYEEAAILRDKINDIKNA